MTFRNRMHTHIVMNCYIALGMKWEGCFWSSLVFGHSYGGNNRFSLISHFLTVSLLPSTYQRAHNYCKLNRSSMRFSKPFSKSFFFFLFIYSLIIFTPPNRVRIFNNALYWICISVIPFDCHSKNLVQPPSSRFEIWFFHSNY